jgi:hypothetical protein
MTSDSEVYDFAESKCEKFRRPFDPNASAYTFAIRDDTTFPDFSGVRKHLKCSDQW